MVGAWDLGPQNFSKSQLLVCGTCPEMPGSAWGFRPPRGEGSGPRRGGRGARGLGPRLANPGRQAGACFGKSQASPGHQTPFRQVLPAPEGNSRQVLLSGRGRQTFVGPLRDATTTPKTPGPANSGAPWFNTPTWDPLSLSPSSLGSQRVPRGLVYLPRS